MRDYPAPRLPRIASRFSILALLAAGAARAEAPLPEAQALVERLIAHQKAVDELRENYTYKVREVEYKPERKKDGLSWKKKGERVLQVFPSRRLPIQRLLEKDGRALSEKEALKEDKRIEKELERWQKREDKRKREAERAGAAVAAEDEVDPDRVRLRDLLRATRLSTVAREREDGRDLLVIDFAGDPGFRARSRAEKFARELQGRMWVDEEDLQVVRAEARLGKVSLKGFVAKLKDARLYFEQRRVDGELWLPVRGEVEYRAKVLLVKGIDGRVTADFYDYQRFGTETETSFGAAPLGD